MKPILIFTPALAFALSSASCVTAQPATPIKWEPMPLVSAESLKMPGVTIGGEGGQWPRRAPQISQSDPNFLLLPIDVGGIYRSTDGGQLWRQSSSGWNARGANDFAVDPKNADRVIGVGGNGDAWNPSWGQSPNGLYISTDKALSWKQTLAVPDGRAGRVVIDPSSFDKTKGYCTTAYYSSPMRGLFRSDDGGASWQGINRIAATEMDTPNAVAMIAVHPTNGTLYLAGKTGFFRSTDKGATFVQSAATPRTENIAGISVIPAQPDKVWICNLAGMSVSNDGGKTFAAIAIKGIERDADAPLRDVTVSPANPQQILTWVLNKDYKWLRYISQDGGQSFVPIALQAGLQTRADEGADQRSNATIAGGPTFLPFNTRNGYFTWHPTDPKIVYGIGGDWVTKSTDGGKTFLWSNNGFNGVMLGSSFNFDASAPETLFIGTQDNNGMFTTDNGKTWNYRNVSGRGWGGYVYGAGQLGSQVMWGGDAESWGGARTIKISLDAGKTWNDGKDAAGKTIVYGGDDISFTDPKTRNLFASNWRSTDKGASWTAMNGCSGVYSHAADGRLFGKQDDALVQSKDGGATWEKLTDVEGGFSDVAFDDNREKWYFASQDQMKSWEKGVFATLDIPKDQRGNTKCRTVAVDPNQTDVVYGGGPANIYKTSATVYRSRDAGKTFENLTRGDGPQEVYWIRVNPKSGEAWLNGQCFGMWKIARPTVLGAADPKLGDSPLQEPVKEGETPAPGMADGKLEIAKVVRDFGPAGLDYTYGPVWKNGENVKAEGDALRFNTTEWGGGGMVLNGANLQPFGETHLAIRARLLPGNAATKLSANIAREGQDGQSVPFDLSQLSADKWTILAVPMPAGDFSKVSQIQLQGGNFSAGAAALRLDIDKIGTLKLAAGTGAKTMEAGTAEKVSMAAATPPVAALASVKDGAITSVIRDLGGLDYTFGPAWKNGENVKQEGEVLRIDTTQAGGGGMVLNGANIAPQTQTHLALRARALPGNAATKLNVNIMRDDDKGGKRELSFDLSGLKENEWTTLTQPLGDGDFSKVNQIQLQGTDWGGDSPPLKIEIDTIGTTSLDEKANEAARLALANDPTAGPPAKAKPDVAGWGFFGDYPQAWMARHNGFLARTKENATKKIGVIFLGDSITQGWDDTGKEVWDKNYEPLGAVNYGIGGDTTRQILWRLQNGEVEGLSPKLVVLKIGTNNLYGDNNAGSDEEIADGIKAIIGQLQMRLPKSKILLLGVLPRQNEYFTGRTSHISSLISKFADGKTIRFLDMSDQFQTAPGKVKPELYDDDQLHLKAAGYEVWAQTMAPVFEQMMK